MSLLYADLRYGLRMLLKQPTDHDHGHRPARALLLAAVGPYGLLAASAAGRDSRRYGWGQG